MPNHPIASLLARLWGGSRQRHDADDTGDLGTAFGMEMSLLEAERRQPQPAPGTAPAAARASRWFRRRGHGATARARG